MIDGARSVLGIDPSSKRIGWACIGMDGDILRSHSGGVLVVPTSVCLQEALSWTHQAIVELVRSVPAAWLAVEGGYSGGSGHTTRLLAQVEAAIRLGWVGARGARDDVLVYPVSSVRSSLGLPVRGPEVKARVMRWAQDTWPEVMAGAPIVGGEDLADALAVCARAMLDVRSVEPGPT